MFILNLLSFNSYRNDQTELLSVEVEQNPMECLNFPSEFFQEARYSESSTPTFDPKKYTENLKQRFSCLRQYLNLEQDKPYNECMLVLAKHVIEKQWGSSAIQNQVLLNKELQNQKILQKCARFATNAQGVLLSLSQLYVTYGIGNHLYKLFYLHRDITEKTGKHSLNDEESNLDYLLIYYFSIPAFTCIGASLIQKRIEFRSVADMKNRLTQCLYQYLLDSTAENRTVIDIDADEQLFEFIMKAL